MGVSLTYIVKRDIQLSNEEKQSINQVIESYRIKDLDEMDWKGENIDIPQYNTYKSPIILEGSIEIGHYEDDYEREIEEVVRWCYCLTEIYRKIVDGDWNVRLGDEELLFDTEIGFHLKRLPKSLHEDLKPIL